MCGCSTARGGWKQPPWFLFPKLTRFRYWNGVPCAPGARSALLSSPLIPPTCGVGSTEEWGEPKCLELVAMVKAGHPTGSLAHTNSCSNTLWTVKLSKPISGSQLLIHSGGFLFPFRAKCMPQRNIETTVGIAQEKSASSSEAFELEPSGRLQRETAGENEERGCI